jgi:hypothetical protein
MYGGRVEFKEDTMKGIKLTARNPQRLTWQFPWLLVAVYGVALYFGLA